MLHLVNRKYLQHFCVLYQRVSFQGTATKCYSSVDHLCAINDPPLWIVECIVMVAAEQELVVGAECVPFGHPVQP